jgi:hypothetical protein
VRDYLALVEILTIHENQFERYGAILGVRDGAMPKAALY